MVDVVRTDKHLEFYSDTRNSARMSDVLAVYAWVDPATGYCQGMARVPCTHVLFRAPLSDYNFDDKH